MFCIIIEPNSKMTFFSVVLCTNMAAMSSGENHLLPAFQCYFTYLNKELYILASFGKSLQSIGLHQEWEWG